MDWCMPGLDGMETTRRIRQLTSAQGSTPVVIMVTAKGQEALEDACTERYPALRCHSYGYAEKDLKKALCKMKCSWPLTPSTRSRA